MGRRMSALSRPKTSWVTFPIAPTGVTEVSPETRPATAASTHVKRTASTAAHHVMSKKTTCATATATTTAAASPKYVRRGTSSSGALGASDAEASAFPPVNTNRHYNGTIYGIGTELSLADMGGSADRSNIRLRAQVDTRGDFHSFRPMMGVVAKF